MMVNLIKQSVRWGCWSAVFGLGVHFASASWSRSLDQSDDFNFVFYRGPRVEGAQEQGMQLSQVHAVLWDHARGIPKEQIAPLARHLYSLCLQYQLDPAYLMALIEVESGFNARAVSPAGALGLMQLMPATALTVAQIHKRPYKGRVALFDAFKNVELGVLYLVILRNRYRDYSPYIHLAAYNMGPTKLGKLMRRSFKPNKTKVYFDSIRRGISKWRSYRSV